MDTSRPPSEETDTPAYIRTARGPAADNGDCITAAAPGTTLTEMGTRQTYCILALRAVSRSKPSNGITGRHSK